jgi:general transcriptional corepressor CYC8
MGELESALQCFEHALGHNQWSIAAMTGIAAILRAREQYAKAVEYLQGILKVEATNGDIWGSLGKQSDPTLSTRLMNDLGHCHLMMDNLQEAYTSYQQALYYLRDPKVL